MTNLKQKFKEKEGIAFIITLGLLAVLMITGVSFAVFMKVEREAAANFALVGSCRQLALSGLAYAMDDISFSLDEDSTDDDFDWYPGLTTTWDSSDYFHGWFETIADFDSSFTDDDKIAYSNLVRRIYLNNNLAKGLIPNKTFDTAKKLYSVGRIDTGDIFGDGEFSDDSGNIAGKFNGNTSYIVVNLSGLLDLNYSGEIDDVAGGTTLFDLSQISGLENNASSFVTARQDILDDGDIYESLAEYEHWVDFDNLAGLYPYSLFIPNSNFVGITEAPLKQKASDYNNTVLKALDTQLLKCNIDYLDFNDVDRVYRPSDYRSYKTYAILQNLIDYLDDDYFPGGPDQGATGYRSLSVEPFPMINEVKFTTTLINPHLNAPDYSATYELKDFWVELWYPFLSPTCSEIFGATDLTLECVFKFPDVQGLIDILPPLRRVRGSYDATVDTVARTLTLSKKIGTFDGFKTEKVNSLFRITISDTNFVSQAYDFTIYFEAKVKDKDGVVLDGFGPVRYTASKYDEYMLEFPNTVNLNGVTDTFAKYCYAEISDPRRNYITAEWNPSIGDDAPIFTDAAINTVANALADTDEQWWDMYVKGYKTSTPETSFESVGELGYLFTGKPGNTIKLTGDDSVRSSVYDNLYLDGSLLSNGYANVNTEFPDVLRAALADMSKEPSSGGTMTKIETDELADMITLLQNKSLNGGISAADLFDTTTQGDIFTALNATDEFAKEAFYIYGYPAFNSRQNLFAIFAMGNYYSAKQVCMAIVWRDPVPDDDGNHPCFIRELTWLNGE
jgi:hypothetical protein